MITWKKIRLTWRLEEKNIQFVATSTTTQKIKPQSFPKKIMKKPKSILHMKKCKLSVMV